MKYFHYILILLTCFVSTQCADSEIGDIGTITTGQGGSLARFTIIGDYLYTLEPRQISWYELAATGQITKKGAITLNEGKETIFPLGDLLFIGATDGLTIFKITADGTPELQAEVQHFISCDPVVANENYAFVTLRQGFCNGLFRPTVERNVLNIYDINDITNPNILASYNMTAPRGMGLAGDYLFVCEGSNGLRTLGISDPQNVELLAFKTDIHANDVIVLEDLLLVIGPDNITQFDYSDPINLIKISEITIE